VSLDFRPAGGSWLVASGKGGAGTSTVAGLLALMATRPGSSVLLVDGDVQFGVQHLLFGVAPAPGLAALRRGEADPLGLPTSIQDGLMLLCGGPCAEDRPLAGVEIGVALRRASTLTRSFDVSVVDAGSRYATVSAALGAGVGRLLAVCRPERISIAATYALIKHVWSRFGDFPVHVLVNAADPAQAQTTFQALSSGCERFLGRSVGMAGAIPQDPGLAMRLAEGVGLGKHPQDGPAHEAARFVATRLHDLTASATVTAGRHALGRM